MSARAKSPADHEAELIEDIAAFVYDPLGFVLYAFDWGEGELAKFPDGPDEWQRGILETMGQALRNGQSREEVMTEAFGQIHAEQPVRIGVASGHGIGKSALVAWIIEWAMATREDTRGVVTANTETQLRTKTWAELAKWHRLCICAHWFELTATAMFSRDPEHTKTWRIDMVPWSVANTEAFAGLHNQGGRILLVFDEASAIDDKIWEVSEGALTDADTEIIWCCFGNPTQNTGRFRDCFRRFKHRWITRQIDSRTVRISNKKQIAEWASDYGEDSDFFRVRVRGVFPQTSSDALISPDDYDAAVVRHYRPEQYQHAAKILGVDVARQGDDATVIFPRQGLVAFKPKVLRIPDTMQIAAVVALAADQWGADAIFVDGTGGYGAGVIDRLRQLGYTVHEVYFSGKARLPRYFNKRSEMLMEMADWIKKGGAIPRLEDFELEATALTYRYQGDAFRVAEKDEIKAEIGQSTDHVDALALTFAFPVAPRTIQQQMQQAIGGAAVPNKTLSDWNPLTAA